jgi:hypothetical protein
MKYIILFTNFMLSLCEDGDKFLKVALSDEQLKTSMMLSDEIIAVIIIGAIVILCCLVTLISTSRRRTRAFTRQLTEQHRKSLKKQEVSYNINGDSVPRLEGNKCELPGQTHTASMIASNRTLGITEKPFLHNKKIIPDDDVNDISMSDDGSARRRIENRNAEASFKIAISNPDNQKEDKEIKELVTRNPKMAPQNVGNVHEKTSTKATAKDIVSNDIYNYTEGKRENFYTEGSEEPEESYERRRGSEDVCQIENMDKKRGSIEKDMTPEEHSDFLDEDTVKNEDPVIEVENYYNSVQVNKFENIDIQVPKVRRNTLLDKL